MVVRAMKIKSIRHVGREPVYNMTVKDAHSFVTAGGFVVHNCDEIRYMCMCRPISPLKATKQQLPIYDPLATMA